MRGCNCFTCVCGLTSVVCVVFGPTSSLLFHNPHRAGPQEFGLRVLAYMHVFEMCSITPFPTSCVCWWARRCTWHNPLTTCKIPSADFASSCLFVFVRWIRQVLKLGAHLMDGPVLAIGKELLKRRLVTKLHKSWPDRTESAAFKAAAVGLPGGSDRTVDVSLVWTFSIFDIQCSIANCIHAGAILANGPDRRIVLSTSTCHKWHTWPVPPRGRILISLHYSDVDLGWGCSELSLALLPGSAKPVSFVWLGLSQICCAFTEGGVSFQGPLWKRWKQLDEEHLSQVRFCKLNTEGGGGGKDHCVFTSLLNESLRKTRKTFKVRTWLLLNKLPLSGFKMGDGTRLCALLFALIFPPISVQY